MKAVRFPKSLEPLLVPIDQVKQHPDNPNNGDDENMVEMIQAHGFVTAVTVDEATGYITAGNTRYRALLALGATHIPVIWAKWDEADGAVRYMIGDNASSRRAVMDQAQWLALMGQLAETEKGLVGASVTQTEYEAALMKYAADAEQLPDMTGEGFGAPKYGPLGMFQVVIDFQENEDERDAIFAELSERYENVRVVNL